MGCPVGVCAFFVSVESRACGAGILRLKAVYSCGLDFERDDGFGIVHSIDHHTSHLAGYLVVGHPKGQVCGQSVWQEMKKVVVDAVQVQAMLV